MSERETDNQVNLPTEAPTRQVEVVDRRIGKQLLLIKQLTATVRKVGFFSGDEDDEFRVIRENGEREGIFKTWAAPVIPFLEEGAMEPFVGDLEQNRPLGEESLEVIRGWSSELQGKPAKFHQTLEKWREFSERYDRRLYDVFTKRPLPMDKEEKATELVLRLKVAFALTSPFYNIEALIAEDDPSVMNPISGSQIDDEFTQSDGGELDLAAMVLPSALADKVTATRLDWGDLSWDTISSSLDMRNPDRSTRLAMRLAHVLDVEPEDIIFAGNVLEWIPASVGGKKDDMPQEEAARLLEDTLDSKVVPKSNMGVAREFNAKIRFHNWMPLAKTQGNFDTGSAWNYASVCDTANHLLELVRGGGILEEGFDPVFQSVLVDQLDGLDATSAKGRFLLSILEEGKFKRSISDRIEAHQDGFYEEVARDLVAKEEEEEIIPIELRRPRALVGGKAAGLYEAQRIFGKDKVVPGFAVTTEATTNWLTQDDETRLLMEELRKSSDIDESARIASRIRERISERQFDPKILDGLSLPDSWKTIAVRSSSVDEDTAQNGTAAGIYESIIGVEQSELEDAIKGVISSGFSRKAVTFRSLHELRSVPEMAVIISPVISGPGGSAFSAVDRDGWEIVVAESPQTVVGAEDAKFDSFKKSGGRVVGVENIGILTNAQLEEVGDALETAERMLGSRVDIEFVLQDERIIILQLRTMNDRSHRNDRIVGFGASEQLAVRGLRETPESRFCLSDLSQLEMLEGLDDAPSVLELDAEIDLDKFQGELFRYLVRNKSSLKKIVLNRRIPRTSHFANICNSLGLELDFNG